MQLVTKMLDKMGASILKEPSQIIAFVDYALGESHSSGTTKKERRTMEGDGPALRMENLKIVDDDEGAEDEDEEEGGLGADEEMTMTGLTLLLALLEGACLLVYVLHSF
jgi:hypothetical protein